MISPAVSVCERLLAKQYGYAHAGELTEAALHRAAASVGAVTNGYNGTAALAPVAGSNHPLYDDGNPLNEMPFDAKVSLLQQIDAFARAADPRVVQVSASLAGSWQAVQIMRRWRARGRHPSPRPDQRIGRC